MKTKTLGRVKRTLRGFEYIEFDDYNGKQCSLQESSESIGGRGPGTSAVWLGCDDEDSTRMHLNRKQVAALIEHLKSWLGRGTFRICRTS